MSKLTNEKVKFITDNLLLLTYDYNNNELEEIGKLLKLNENHLHPEDGRDVIGLSNILSNSISFYVRDIFPYTSQVGNGIKLDPRLNIINPYKTSTDDFSLLHENTNNFMKYVRTIYPESISRLAWGGSNNQGKYLKDLYPDIKTNFNFFSKDKSSILDMISENYYLAPVNLEMIKNASTYIYDPRFKYINKKENPDFYLFSLFLKNIFNGSENLLKKDYENFLRKEVHSHVNITSSEDYKFLLRDVLSRYFRDEDCKDSMVSLIKNNKSNPKYDNYKKIDDEVLKEMFNYIDPLRFLYSFEIEGENMGNCKLLNETILDYKEYKKFDMFTRIFIEKLNYVFALFNKNGTTYSYPLNNILEKLEDEKDIVCVSIIPIPYNENKTMFEFFRCLLCAYKSKCEEKLEVFNTSNNFGLNINGSIMFIEFLKSTADPGNILRYYIILQEKYRSIQNEEVFHNNVEKQKFVEFFLRRLGFKVKCTKVIKCNREFLKLDVVPKPSVTYFKDILSRKHDVDLTNGIKKLCPLVTFVSGFSSQQGGNKGGDNESDELIFSECRDPIEMYNWVDHKALNDYLSNTGDEVLKYNFFTGEDIEFEKDIDKLNENGNISENTLCDIIPLNIYYKKKFTTRLNEMIKDSGGKKIYDTISDFLNSIEDARGGIKQVYDNVGELLTDLTSSQNTEQETLIRSILNNILTTNSLNTYDLSVLKKKISMIDNYTSNREEKESNKLMFNISNLIAKLNSLKAKGIEVDAFDEEFYRNLHSIYFNSLALYQYLNLIEVIRNLFMLLPVYGVSICSKKITNSDIKKIDKMFLQSSLKKKNNNLKRRFADLKKNLNIPGDNIDYVTLIDKIYSEDIDAAVFHECID